MLDRDNVYTCECRNHIWKVITRGFVVLASPRDKKILQSGRFHFQAMRSKRPNGYALDSQCRPLHRMILRLRCNAKGKFKGHVEGDHRNGVGLDCRRNNLRKSNRQQNARNQRSHVGSSSRFLGVAKKKSRWIAQIWPSKIQIIHLGSFDTEEEAAIAYDRAARKYFGKFCNLNFP